MVNLSEITKIPTITTIECKRFIEFAQHEVIINKVFPIIIVIIIMACQLMIITGYPKEWKHKNLILFCLTLTNIIILILWTNSVIGG